MQGSETHNDLLKQFEPVGLEQLNDHTQYQVKAARDIFNELNRLMKSITLYGAHHQSSLNFRGRFFEVINSSLAKGDPITVQIETYAVTVADQVIYEDGRIEGNFIYRFYTDGIRSLTFKPGIKASEVDQLLSIFLTDWSQASLFEDDSVTLLWAQRFEHISYEVAIRYDEDTQEADAHLFNFTEELDRLSDLCSTSKSSVALPVSRPSFSEQLVSRVDQLSKMSQRELLEKLISLAHETQSEREQVSGNDRFVQLADQLAQLFAKSSQIGELERLIRQVFYVATPLQRSRCIELWAVPVFVRQLMHPLRAADHPEVLSALACLRLFESAAVPHIARALGEVVDAHVDTMLKLIVPHINDHPIELYRIVRTSEYLHVKRLLSTLFSSAEDTFCLKLFETGWEHEDQGVRYESLLALPERLYSHPQLTSRLIQGLSDSYSKIRTLSCFRLSKLKDEASRQSLSTYLTEAGREQELVDLRKLYAALALMGEDVSYFLEQVNQQSSGFSLTKLAGQGATVLHSTLIGLALAQALSEDQSTLDQVTTTLEKAQGRRIGKGMSEPAKWGLTYLDVKSNQRDQMVYELFFRNQLTTPKGR